MVTCAQCGRQNRVDFSFCQECGKPLVPDDSFQCCPECGLPRVSGLRFCGQCGASLVTSIQRASGEISSLAQAARDPARPAPPSGADLGKTYIESPAAIAERLGNSAGGVQPPPPAPPIVGVHPAPPAGPGQGAVTVIPQAAIAAARADAPLGDAMGAVPELGPLRPLLTGPPPPAVRPDASPPTRREPPSQRTPQSHVVPAVRWPRLVSVDNDGMDGEAFEVTEPSFDVGRVMGHLTFAGDAYLSDNHCRIEQRGQSWYVQDLNSLNGVYLRVRQTHVLGARAYLLAGTHVFVFSRVNEEELELKPAVKGGVMLFGSPLRAPWASVQVLVTAGMCRDARYLYRPRLVVGREGADWSFSDDEFMSRRHFELALDDDQAQVRDLRSSNGTFVRIDKRTQLSVGDLIRIGNQLLRFELPGAR